MMVLFFDLQHVSWAWISPLRLYCVIFSKGLGTTRSIEVDWSDFLPGGDFHIKAEKRDNLPYILAYIIISHVNCSSKTIDDSIMGYVIIDTNYFLHVQGLSLQIEHILYSNFS